jgi:hypothetical protein
MSKVRPIGTIGKLLFKAAYPFGKKKVDDLFKDGTFGDKAAIGALNAVDESVEVLSDSDPENKKQLNAVWVGYLRETLLPAVGEEVQPVLTSVKSVALEALLVSLAGKIVDSTYLFLDDIKENPEQLKAFASEYFQGADFRALFIAWVTELVNDRISDELGREFFIVAINGLFDLLQGIDFANNSARALIAK